jgi:hypothetical protein
MLSVAGLATAIVCSKVFERVVIVEPDSMAESRRTRVAQAEQIHGKPFVERTCGELKQEALHFTRYTGHFTVYSSGYGLQLRF